MEFVPQIINILNSDTTFKIKNKQLDELIQTVPQHQIDDMFLQGCDPDCHIPREVLAYLLRQQKVSESYLKLAFNNAVNYRFVESMEELIKARVHQHKLNNSEFTIGDQALVTAIEKDYLEIAKMLICAGVNTTYQNNRAFMLAKKKKYFDLNRMMAQSLKNKNHTRTRLEVKKWDSEEEYLTEFKKFLMGLFHKCRTLSSRPYITELVENPNYFQLFRNAFTHRTIDEQINYEFLELIGDKAVNFKVIMYLNQHYPELRNPKAMTPVFINLISTKGLGYQAKNLGFLNFIRINMEANTKSTINMLKVLEDVFEAFAGALTLCVDELELKYRSQLTDTCDAVGEFISAIMKNVRVNTNFREATDVKTQLNELYASLGWKWPAEYTVLEKPTSEGGSFRVTVKGYPRGKAEIVGMGCHMQKKEAERLAAHTALAALEKMGIRRRVYEKDQH